MSIEGHLNNVLNIKNSVNVRLLNEMPVVNFKTGHTELSPVMGF